jgi:carbamoyltransferase
LVTIIGVSAGSHDAGVAVIEDNKVKYASHSERYSKIKNDPYLNDEIIEDALSYITKPVDIIAFYEKPLLKKTRQLYAGQWYDALFDFYYKKCINKIIKQLGYKPKIEFIRHHKTHAGHAYISPYDKAIVLVIDSIGEWDTISIWLYDNNELTLLENVKYPISLGLFYSAFTQYVGLKPNEHEYILMGMSSFGQPIYVDKIKNEFNFTDYYKKLYIYNFHRGVRKELIFDTKVDLAASVQCILEETLSKIAVKIKEYQEIYEADNLVYSGGIALNCVANSRVFLKNFKNIFIYPNPGDCGTSLGAALVVNKKKANFETIYLGHDIKGNVNPREVVDYILENKIAGLAVSRAEFGPRALGNRSLLADPRGYDIKDKVNEIKKREKFRPFAPIILEEKFDEYFETMGRKNSPYMQYVFKCKYPDKYPAIVHIDNSSRVQTVNEKQNKLMYDILKILYEKTGCPMLLNTSLNIKGQPIVNDLNDIKNFEKLYVVKVFH